ncbi:large ribosomal subunit protein uL4z-like [Cryptomeria japonica]|uniref:large ribosomal subunit protein uL4z-like n=1 Tax=Cryptomeria japonica TaxID=3369 RepID=UPI0027D9FAD7|nr:large ribosomal subunit protein uL4z-like [Cryptomeria japonica]
MTVSNSVEESWKVIFWQSAFLRRYSRNLDADYNDLQGIYSAETTGKLQGTQRRVLFIVYTNKNLSFYTGINCQCSCAVLPPNFASNDIQLTTFLQNNAQIKCRPIKRLTQRYVSKQSCISFVRAFKNLPGVEVACVDRLNLLKLAPGGHLGRFIIWTKFAFEKLDAVFGTFEKESLQKKGYELPRSKMVNSDLARIVNSDEVQSVVRPIQRDVKRKPLKKNPLKNLGALLKLNPYAKTARRMALLAEAERVKARHEKLDKKRKELKDLE